MKAPRLLGGRCYLGVCEFRHLDRVKRTLLHIPSVQRLTDHGTHLKVHTTRRLPIIRGFRTILVRDHTHDWDSHYWVVAMAVARYMLTRRQHPPDALGVLMHYVANLLGIPEAEWCDLQSAKRRWTDRTLSDEVAHGWELRALRQAKLL